jgi:molybdopterin-guanine dinucleotide biosynthesis protein A
MLGVILCGGQSTRMGSDKGLLKLQAATWAQTAVDKIMALGLPVFLSVNEDQYNSYATVFSAAQLILDNERITLKGPLKGLLSAHLQHPGDDLFVLACDMPLMETEVLQQLSVYAQQHPAEAWVFSNEGLPEPLCGIYTAAGLVKITAMHTASQLLKHSMKYALEQLHTMALPINADQKKFFRNFNAHAELNGL